MGNLWSEEEPEPEPDAEKSNTIAIVGGAFGTLGALVIIIALIVIWLRKRGRKENKFIGFGLTTRRYKGRGGVDINPEYTGQRGERESQASQYQYDLNNQARTNAADRNPYYSGYNYAASLTPSQV